MARKHLYGCFRFVDKDGKEHFRKPTPKQRKNILIYYLRRRSGRCMRVADIAAAFHVSERTMQKLLKELETEKIIRRERVFDTRGLQKASKQNMLIADLTTSVNEIKSDNSFYLKRQSENVQSAVKEIREITQDERKFKTEVSQTIKSEIGRTVAEAKAHALEQVDETLSEIKEQLKSTAKEIEREREDMKLVHGVRKFMFWATPVLLFVQTITLIFLLLN